MRQSIIIAMPPTWNLMLIGKCLESCEALKHLELRLSEEQAEIHSKAGVCAIIEEIPERDPETGADNKEELISDPRLNEQFREDLKILRLFAVDYKDIEVARHVLRCLMEMAVNMGGAPWIDSPESISARDFLIKISQDPKWDWRENEA